MENINDLYYAVGDFQISKICKKTFPCKHDVLNTKTNETCVILGTEIFKLLKENNISIAHFNKFDPNRRICASASGSIEYLTPEQEKQREKRLEQYRVECEKQLEEANIKRKEQQKIIDQFKASSHLEKLKTKNNIK